MVPDRLTNSLVTFLVFDASIWTSLVNVDSAYLLKCTTGRNPVGNKALGHPQLSGMVCLSIGTSGMCQDFNMDALRASVCIVAMRFWASWRQKTGLELADIHKWHVWAIRGLLEVIILHADTKALECLWIKTCRITPKKTLGPFVFFRSDHVTWNSIARSSNAIPFWDPYLLLWAFQCLLNRGKRP